MRNDEAPLPPMLIPPASPAPVLVAFSGGLDSSVLLHLLAEDPVQRARGLRAIHIDHGLHPRSAQWADHCRRVCALAGVVLQVVKVTVEPDGSGPEAAARRARRRAFAQALVADEILALAQHRDDQAETFLLRALRGSGPDGLAAMRPWRRFGQGWMWRPLLGTPRAALHTFAHARGLEWIEDPSNAETGYDRNFIRLRVMPLLRERWPHGDAAFARAAELSGETAGLLAAQDAQDFACVAETTDAGTVLSVAALRALPPPRRARVLRHWVASMDWPPLPGAGLVRLANDLLEAAPDRIPIYAWRCAGTAVEIRRWRERLHAVDPTTALPQDWSQHWDGRDALRMPNGDRLELVGTAGFDHPLRAHARIGGEWIELPERSDSLKAVLQKLNIPPWERARMPLLSTMNGILLAAGDRAFDRGFSRWLKDRRARLIWTRRAHVAHDADVF